MGKTLAEKVWDEHVVRTADGEPDLLYIDLHLIHEVTSPQAFDGLRLAGRTVRRPGGEGERVGLGCTAPQRDQPEAEGVATIGVPPEQAMGLESGRETVGRGPADAGAGGEVGRPHGCGAHHPEEVDRLVQHADPA